MSNAKQVAPWKRSVRRVFTTLLVLATLGLAGFVVDEVQTSRQQADWLSERARQLSFEVQPGPSPAIRFAGNGPYDQRLGYHQLPQLVERLDKQGFSVTAQARMSPALLALRDEGLFATYREKAQAGLVVRDCRGEPLFEASYPERIYARFDAVPPLLIKALLFIENRDLLDPPATRNPAVEWDRFGKVVFDQLVRRVDESHNAAGGSTLATQIEKYRHSPQGRTESARDKLRQMASASLRAYLDGQDTTAHRRTIVLDYLNTVPLSAQTGFGEVNGLGDGLWAWFGRDFAEVNRLLATPIADGLPGAPRREALAFKQALLPLQALAFKQALALMVAQRRPSFYLDIDQEPTLRELTNSHLRLLADAGVISPTLRDAALPLPLQLLARLEAEPPVSFVERKAANAVRGKLQQLLGLSRAYDLDRLDLAVNSSLAGDAQHAAGTLLRSLSDPDAAKAAGLYGFRLLNEGDDTSKLVFSFTLFERSEGANLLRVQTDNLDQPFDLNEGARLDLGSTAKLRTLITYLEQVAELHERWSDLDAQQLAALDLAEQDPIGRWAREHLAAQSADGGDRGLATMLEAALQRSYSASPDEGFFTGGGLHHFDNFEPEDDSRTLTVREALTRSVNLVFIRLMRDVVRRVMADKEDMNAALLGDADDPARQAYLARFADKEGRSFIVRFYRQFAGKTPEEVEDALLRGVRRTPSRLASVFYGLQPQAGESDLARFLARHLPDPPDAAKLHEKYRTGRWSLADRAYLAGVHPLAMWVAGHLRQHPGATLTQTLEASSAQRQEAYGWLFKTRHKSAQDSRIRNQLEQEAFAEVHRAWKRLGYPFEALTPSYATALGASGDRPGALAELMGIIVNRGMALPQSRIHTLRFAAATPYETHLAYHPPAGERVMKAEVADVVRKSLIGVVEEGTAKRLKGVLTLRDGRVVPIGGKTGTGDHRFDIHGPGGKLISSRVVNRSATLAFLIGDRYFGTLMAYVHEPDAANYKFTSALPSQLLKALLPTLLPLVEGSACVAPPPVVTASNND
ncbi:MAG TPA: transglycosylase domain-containing protein [Ideonella sp.]|uniref:transglycosylase domain-containing protein n=1 Tax=Ideonella sp. TaxID=1929293 RepID=UPI002E374268|nr:transglycosylase domain-containing protein [Ideonella sp.]HEX5687003.1 transglycosylase domain-containing protein [Ideonella sp.]